MYEVKTMPYSERYAIVMDRIKSHDTLLSPFTKKYLDEQAFVELRRLWQEGVKPIPEGSSDEEKYEIAYGNLMWQGKNNLEFIRTHLGEDGIEQYKLAQVEEYKRKNTSPALVMLGLLRAISPGLAFTLTAKKLAYNVQWITPFSLAELTRDRAVFKIPRCKIVSVPGMEESCVVDCQGAFSTWITEQFKVGLKFEPQGESCTAILTRSIN